MTYLKRVVPLLLMLIAIAGLTACGGDDDDSSAATGDTTSAGSTVVDGSAMKPAGTTIIVKDGEPVGGVQELEYSAGEEVRFAVRSDVADEIHVHGYDLMNDVAAGGSVSFAFSADIEGIFEIELEGRKEQIAELRVNP